MAASSLLSSSAGFFVGSIFDPEDRRHVLLRHVRLSPNKMAIHPEDCVDQNGKGFRFCSHNGKKQSKWSPQV
jgi:hypothetical protein